MERNYDTKTLEALRKEEKHETIFGTDVVVRRIPFESRKGLMDPRLKANMDTKKTIDGVIAPPPFDPAILALPAEKVLLILQQMQDASAKKKEEEALRLRPDGSADDIVDADISCEWGTIDGDGHKVGYYRYAPLNRENKMRPCMIMIHGGGWCMGHPARNDAFCRFLSAKADAIVYDIDYALAPQNPFPAGLNDCWNLLKYLFENAESLGIDNKKIIVGGGSAGGNLTAALALKDRDEKTNMIALQVPMVPCLLLRNRKVDGYKVSLEDYELAEETIEYCGKPEIPEGSSGIEKMVEGYVGIGEGDMNPYASPLLAKDFSGLPKAIIQVSSLDGLWPHGVYYGKFMRKAGCDVKIIKYDGMDHGSVGSVGIYPQAEDLLQEIVETIEKL